MKALIRKAKAKEEESSLCKGSTANISGHLAEDGAGAGAAPDRGYSAAFPAQAATNALVTELTLPAQPVQVEDRHRVGNIPSVFLVEEWLPLETEVQLLAHLRARTKEFTQLRGKRTARFGGDPGPPFEQELLPPFLGQLCAAVGPAALGELRALPNHVLVNHYGPGEGIMPHTDGPAYELMAAIISLCSAVTFSFWRDHAHTTSGEAPSLSLLLPPRSLLLFHQEAYSSHLHGIVDRRYDEINPGVVANWIPEQRKCFDPMSAEAPAWATRQLKGFSTGATSCNLQREERYSLTIRRVPPALASPDT